MAFFDFIIWSPAPNIISDWNIPRWYGLLFAMGFIVSQQIMYFIYKKEGLKEKEVDVLTVHMILGVVLGARLGHCLFYNPLYYLKNPIEIFMIWEGGLASHGGALGILIAVYVFVNYDIRVKFFPLIKGIIGIPTSIKSTKKKREGQSFLWMVDRLVIVVAITGTMIRTGNFINSEIIGIPTDSEYGVVFSRSLEESMLRTPLVNQVEFEEGKGDVREGLVPMKMTVHFQRDKTLNDATVKTRLLSSLYNLGSAEVRRHIVLPKNDQIKLEVKQKEGHYIGEVDIYGIPRHPAQLYEAIYCLVLFFAFFHVWYYYREKIPQGMLFGAFLALLWALRFLDEFFKENQEKFEDDYLLNMGQILSIPLFSFGLFMIFYSLKTNKKSADKITNA